MSTFESRRDQRIADEVADDRTLMCAAHGCPNRWSVDAGNGRLCSAHAWADTRDWQAITHAQRNAQTDRAMAAQRPAPARPMVSKREAIQRLRSLDFGRSKGKSWAERLRDRELAGERLTDAQKRMWRSALRADLPSMPFERMPEPEDTARAPAHFARDEADEDLPYAFEEA
ncbi:hypothetical protein [Eleftheria terrae]|uniref:hypothetical protein n=1 Tax=Eleftheria terrae TaxID=1597781 RepID=UPI00263B5FDB|nr:hypothetical protein [Eleftheria terrae]WKB53001.1 hypothetical protein N7L95_00940 [Eleftheria terrae]